jgi:hypothetical protein
MDSAKSVWYLSGHGAKDESALMQLRSETQERYNFLGNTDVHVYTPVGDSHVSVESQGLPESYVYTNTSIIPSYLYALLCDEAFDKRLILDEIAKISQKLDKLSEIEYPNPGERFQRNPTDEKWYWGKPQGEDHRPKSGQPNRVSAEDPLHFPFCLTCITMYDDAATGEIHSNIHPTIKKFMLSSHCGKLEDHGHFPDRDELLKNLEKEGLPLRTFLHPFKKSPTPGVFTNLADFNLFARKNSGMIRRAMQEISKDARDRLAAAAANPYYEHDVWLTENLQLVTSFYEELVTTKRSTLSRIMAICKFVSPPNTDLEILDYTCSCDFATQPPLHHVSSGVAAGDSTPRTIDSYLSTPAQSSQSSSSQSSSSQSSSQLSSSQLSSSQLSSPSDTPFTDSDPRNKVETTTDITKRRIAAAAAAADATAAAAGAAADHDRNDGDDGPARRTRSKTPPHRRLDGGSIKRVRKRTQKRYISRKYSHIKKHKKRYYTKKRRNI